MTSVWVMVMGALDDAGSQVKGVYATKDAARPDMEALVKDMARFKAVTEAFATDENVYVELGLDYVELTKHELVTEAGQPALTA